QPMKNTTLALVAETEEETAANTAPPAQAPAAAAAAETAPPEPDGTWLRKVDWLGLSQSWGVRLASLAVGVLLWHVACASQFNFFINFENVPAPLTVATAFIQHLQESKFYIHIGVSMQRILIGFA